MHPVAKTLVIAGGVLILIGILWHFGSKSPFGFGKLPGDIAVEKPGFRFYFPVMSSILLSIALSLVLWVIQRFMNR